MRDREWLRERLAAIDIVLWDGQLEDLGVDIRWMRWRKTKTILVFGLCRDRAIIEVSPLFRHEWVPERVVLSTIHHEACHAVLGSDHDETFRLWEQRFPHYAESEVWLANAFQDLLRAVPPGRGPSARSGATRGQSA